MTKAELIQAIKQKVAKAKPPVVKRVFFRGLERETKAQLEWKLRYVHVTHEGDISLV